MIRDYCSIFSPWRFLYPSSAHRSRTISCFENQYKAGNQSASPVLYQAEPETEAPAAYHPHEALPVALPATYQPTSRSQTALPSAAKENLYIEGPLNPEFLVRALAAHGLHGTRIDSRHQSSRDPKYPAIFLERGRGQGPGLPYQDMSMFTHWVYITTRENPTTAPIHRWTRESGGKKMVVIVVFQNCWESYKALAAALKEYDADIPPPTSTSPQSLAKKRNSTAACILGKMGGTGDEYFISASKK
ncbi:hypothetical protein IF1G_11230 [Cordyceps javanica]|uniref:Uncharacterized protein n=1 Tax=Cordyceps javanica TaxID=43265 RepID=A0A545UKV4_9HYPO|nr:hypothetical protein IF1G_11230 [Cordyceps javanica]